MNINMRTQEAFSAAHDLGWDTLQVANMILRDHTSHAAKLNGLVRLSRKGYEVRCCLPIDQYDSEVLRVNGTRFSWNALHNTSVIVRELNS